MIQESSSKFSNIIKNIFIVVILISTFLDQYVFIKGISIGETINIFMIILLIMFCKNNINKKSYLWLLFYVICLIFSFVSALCQNFLNFIIITRWIRYFSYIIMIIFSSSIVDKIFFYRVYRILCITLSCYIILQTIFFYLFNIVLPAKILPFNWELGSNGIDIIINNANTSYFRAYGVFSEPGYAAKFLTKKLKVRIFFNFEKVNS